MAVNSTYGFNLTKFCFLAGNAVGVTKTYRVILLIVFVIIGLLVILANGIALFTVIKKRAQYLQKKKLFVLSLIIYDLLSGCTVIPLFIIELGKHREKVDCTISSLRVIFFGYFLSCRILGIFFISLQTYIKINRQKTTFEYRFDNHAYLINAVLVWVPGIIFILAIGFSNVKTDKILGMVVFFAVGGMVIGSIICYVMVLKVIKKAKKRHQSDIYKEATMYIKKVLLWFLVTNIPLGICGFILLIYAFFPEQKKRDNIVVQQIYVVCLAITAADAIINPYLFLHKHSDLNTYIREGVKTFIFRKQPKIEIQEGDISMKNTYHTFHHTNIGYESNEHSASID